MRGLNCYGLSRKLSIQSFDPAQMPDITDLQSRAAPWTRLWRTGVLHSCASGIDGNYDDAFAAFWQQQLTRLHDDAVIVDVGTGNGAIPLLAQSISKVQNRRWRLHGVDMADIDPRSIVSDPAHSYGNILFHPNTSMTELPFADSSVDMVCSQFAFEYAPRERAADEILRVIGQRGRAALVVHGNDSVVHAVSLSQAGACDWLLDESGIFDAAGNLLRHLARATDVQARNRLSLDPQAESARVTFNETAAQLMDRIGEAPEAKILQTVAQELARMMQRPWGSQSEVAEAMDSLQAWARDENTRLRLMLEATLDPAALQHVTGLLSGSGLPVHTGRLMYRGVTPMGWTLIVGHE